MTVSKLIPELATTEVGGGSDAAASGRARPRASDGEMIEVSAAALEEIESLYDRSLNLQAWRVAQQVGPLHRWAGTDARIMAGRLANNLGGTRLGRLLHIRAWQDDPGDHYARYYYALHLLERKGPYATWAFVKSFADLEDAPADLRADWKSFTATIAAMLRDFGRAERLIADALTLSGGQRAWIWVEQAFVLLQQDRHEDALSAARHALEVNPVYRPAIQSAGQILAHLNRDDEALDLLQQAAARTESAPILTQLAAVLGESKRYAEARELWGRVIEASPLADRDVKRFLAARQSDMAYHCGDFAAAAAFAREAGRGFFETIAKRLSEDLTGKARVELPVPFVRQHHMTCAPATLAAICRYWRRPAEHMEIVEAICYDGTPAHSERNWAEGQGFVCREFRVTWESAVALIDRGVPFTLSTTEATSAHLQAVIGYDARRGTLIIRDPSVKFAGEGLADGLVERYESTGPRGMALVPADEAHRLDGLDLPEADFYDDFHRVQTALMAHRRGDAVAACGAMEARDAGHRLTHWARRSIACYDADPVAQHRSTEALLGLYPNDALLRLHRVGLLRNLARRSDILQALAEAAGDPRNDPVFLQQYAQELSADPREVPRAERLLRTCLRRRGGEAATYYILGNVLWGRRAHAEALDLYRFATCLDDKDDQFASTWFGAARHFHVEEEALAMLRERFERFGGRSSGPALTLFRALLSVERTADAFDVLERGLNRRPGDPDLLLQGADAHARYGDHARAAEFIARAADRAHPAAHRRALASLANYRGELAEALGHWRQILESEPLARDAHQNVAQLLAETQGREAALEHLRAAAERFEHHYPLHQTWIGWLRGNDAERLEPLLRRLLEARPADAWLVRELSICLARLGRGAEAVAAAEDAVRLDPTNTCSHSVAARAYAVAGRPADAASACREAVALSVDNDDAIELWADVCATAEERRGALAFVTEQLVAQTTFGDGLLAFRRVAGIALTEDEVLRTLTDALDARPDLWHAWSAKARQLADMGRLADAVAVAAKAVERFPLAAKLWLDLAEFQALAGDTAGEERSLGKALAIAPGWGPAVRQMAGTLCREARFAEAARHLRTGINWAPLDPLNYGCLADALWKMGERDEAVEQARKGVQLAPSYDWAWLALRAWGAELKRPGLAAEAARELVARRGGEARSWFTLARVLDEGPEALEERLAALDRAVALEPLEVDYHDFRAFLLARYGRYDEALAACAPAAFAPAPGRLRGRAAWVLAVRGDVEGAITGMRRVCEDEPRYVWGWTMLAEWHRDAKQFEGYLHAARQLVRIAPLEASSWGLLGDAHDRNRETEPAKAAFRRAAEIDPAYTFGGFGLFDLELASGDLEVAGRTIERLARHERGPLVTARRVQLASRREDAVAAVGALRDLSADANVEPFHVRIACEAMDGAGMGRSGEDALRDAALAGADTTGAAGSEWVRRLVAREEFREVERALDRLLSQENGEGPKDARQARGRVVARYLQALGEGRQKVRLMRFVRRRAAALRADGLMWGVAGAAMLDALAYRRSIAWMAGWESRPDVQQWMITNLAQCHHALGDDREALRLARVALEPRFAEDGSPWPHLLLGFDAALAGRLDEAARHAEAVRRVEDRMDADTKFAYAALSAILETVRTTGPNPRTSAAMGYARARAALARLTVSFPKFRRNRGQRRFYRQAARAIARRRGTVLARLWAVTRTIHSYTRLN